MLRDDPEHPLRVGFAGELDGEVAGPQLEELGEESGVVDVRAAGGVVVAAGAGVHADAGALVLVEPPEDLVVQGDEVVEHAAVRTGRASGTAALR
ncbi:hypothetical protein [Streptomyces sp. WAC05374]|uniref:hypothetical protein n=1 Tax=Streptomyces sp. WAC05374 TaxID=2487420 RepID=UPI001F221825